MKSFSIMAALLLTCFSAMAQSQAKASQEVEAFDRGLGQTLSGTVFVPKGTVATGVSFSYKNISLGEGGDDSGYSMLFGMLGGIKANMSTFGITPQVSYFVADNLSLGVRLGYKRSNLGLGNASLSISDDMGFDIKDYNIFNHKYTGAFTFRYYLSLAGSKRFGIFVEARLNGAYGQAKMWKQQGEDKYGSYSESLDLGLNFVPGICIFGNDNIAVEVAIGVLGLEYSKVDQYRNQVEHSVMTQSGANFRINPLSIELGVCFYFYTGPHSKKARLANRNRSAYEEVL